MNERSFIFEVNMRTRDENKEAAIRQKALEMIVKHGFDGFSMQKLARAASVSPATIYIYFKDREDLLLQLCQEVSQKMMDATLKDFDPAMSFSEGLKLQWINRARYCMEIRRFMKSRWL
jgi:TetR/AcrR family transcriptional regulator, multidrug resistance operon repressor